MLFPCVLSAQENKDHVNTADDPDDCVQESASEHWLDKTRANTFTGMCKTVRWFDHLFGDEHEFNDEGFGGKVRIGFKHSERDGFNERLRLRIKSKLPNVSSRLNAFIGRVDEDAYISNSKRGHSDDIVVSELKKQNQDDEWLIGLGYSNPKSLKKGFDYSLGMKISSGLNPYTKIRYHYNFTMPQGHYSQASQTLFWRRDDGYGTTTNLDYFYELAENDLLKLAGSLTHTQHDEQWEGYVSATWFHRLARERGISAKAYIHTEEKNKASKVPDYGVSLSYRRPIFREWLYLETGINYQWYIDDIGMPREGSFGVGLQFEMVLGKQ